MAYSYAQCKQCFYYAKCSTDVYPVNLCGSDDEEYADYVNSIEERRKRMQSLMMDCFKSPQQHKKDIESSEKSRLKNKSKE